MTVVLASCAFWAPFAFTLVGDDIKPETVRGRARFKRLKASERRALDARIEASALTADRRAALRATLDDPAEKMVRKERMRREAVLAAEPIGDEEFLGLVLVDWELRDKRGETIPYTPANMAEVCEEWDGFEGALVGAYFEATRAILTPEAMEKNSDAQSGTTSA